MSLLPSLYGLKQAARVWNQKIHPFLLKIGFIRSRADLCLYIDVKHGIYITIWVDDLLIASKHGRDIATVKAQPTAEFEMKDFSELTHFLGMRISRHNGTILEWFGMQDSKPVSTPLAAGTRPEISYAVQQLSQFASTPMSAHLQAAKRVLRYLQGSQR
jgi:hypothetical protein